MPVVEGEGIGKSIPPGIAGDADATNRINGRAGAIKIQIVGRGVNESRGVRLRTKGAKACGKS
jgi:hypothetical protein